MGTTRHRAAVRRRPAGPRARRRLPRLPVPGRRAAPAHARRHLRAVADRRRPDHPGGGRASIPQRSLLLRALNGTTSSPPLTIREVARRRPLPDLQRRPAGRRVAPRPSRTPWRTPTRRTARRRAHPARAGRRRPGQHHRASSPTSSTPASAAARPEATAEADPDATGRSADRPPGRPRRCRGCRCRRSRTPPASPSRAADDAAVDPTTTAPTRRDSAGRPAARPAPRGHRDRASCWSGCVIAVIGLLLGAQPVLRRRRSGARSWSTGAWTARARHPAVSAGGLLRPGRTAARRCWSTTCSRRARDQVLAGIQAGTLDDARDIVSRLAGQMLPSARPATPTTTAHRPGTACRRPARRQPRRSPRPPPRRRRRRPAPAAGRPRHDRAGQGPRRGDCRHGGRSPTRPTATGGAAAHRAPEPGVTCRRSERSARTRTAPGAAAARGRGRPVARAPPGGRALAADLRRGHRDRGAGASSSSTRTAR